MATHGVTHDGSRKYFTECVVLEQFRRTELLQGRFKDWDLLLVYPVTEREINAACWERQKLARIGQGGKREH